MIHFLVATHGPLATALLESSRMVYGTLPKVTAVTLTEQAGIEEFREDFSRALHAASIGADGVLVLCDMQSGTPWNVACQFAFSPQMMPPVAVVAGVNFPMLLQTDEVSHYGDVQTAARQLIALTHPSLILAELTVSDPSDDF
ncbi:PTS fructose transporter subunit IIA [Superficieibacter electus]|uniref:PTS fructose transporter subunit IIA n=1 Tax=Superficieibacter electus TaxID=2022662 RepID=A0A2P5GJ02_9ENTR|nr:PTS fructose transporter subunit IIA [Superficieibacter electus]POP41296.1 PTS fructose transporter subunit IIA [Superficieibacter electus]POP43502.1 PTS fructose transporter subunit IIA [Superficieibacter electus]